MSISVGNYEDIMTIYIFRMRSLNLVSSAKSVVLSFLCHNCGNMWPGVQRRHISGTRQNNPPAVKCPSSHTCKLVYLTEPHLSARLQWACVCSFI